MINANKEILDIEEKYNKIIESSLNSKNFANKTKNKYSLLYAFIVNSFLIIGVIIIICLFTIYGELWRNSLVIFSSIIIIFLLIFMKALDLLQKEIKPDKKKIIKKGDKQD